MYMYQVSSVSLIVIFSISQVIEIYSNILVNQIKKEQLQFLIQ